MGQVVVVNDASTDHSPEAIKKCIASSTLSNVQYVFLEHSTNKGHGSARNTAIQVRKVYGVGC